MNARPLPPALSRSFLRAESDQLNPSFANGLLALAAWLAFAVPAAAKPNLLVIVADDQACSTLGAYGDTVCDTPHLDRLAAEGMTFDAARHMGSWSGAVCTPSRHMIMLGRTVWRLPNSPAESLRPPASIAQQSVPAVFNRAGYDTFRTCKIGNSYPDANALFQVRREATKRGGTPEDGSAWHGRQTLDYLTERERRGDDAPWLIYLGFSHPHDARNGPHELLEKYGATLPEPPATPNPAAPPLPVSYLPEHPFPIGHPGLRDEVAVPGVGKRRDEATVRNELGKQAACIEAIDTQIGLVLDQIEATGELDNTYVLFTADHGIAVGSHGLMGKQNLYEHSWRVPFLVRGPGIEPGSRSDAMIYLLDLLPTLCEIAEIDIPKTVEGRSFAAALRGKTESPRSIQYGVYSGGTKPGIRSVTDGRWKLIEYDVLEGAVRETQLFDLEANPDELLDGPGERQRDLAEDADYAIERRRLEELLAAEAHSLGDPYWPPTD